MKIMIDDRVGCFDVDHTVDELIETLRELQAEHAPHSVKLYSPCDSLEVYIVRPETDEEAAAREKKAQQEARKWARKVYMDTQKGIGHAASIHEAIEMLKRELPNTTT